MLNPKEKIKYKIPKKQRLFRQEVAFFCVQIAIKHCKFAYLNKDDARDKKHILYLH